LIDAIVFSGESSTEQLYVARNIANSTVCQRATIKKYRTLQPLHFAKTPLDRCWHFTSHLYSLKDTGLSQCLPPRLLVGKATALLMVPLAGRILG